jgi:hypothetical protein
MNHSFDVEVATRFGVQEAIFIENVRFWVLKNKANNKHFYKGKYWTYNSAKAYAELFPYWSKQQIERIIAKLKEAGILVVDHFSTNHYDRTNWYTINEEMLSSKSMNQNIEIDESSNTYVNTDVNSRTVMDAEVVLLFEMFYKAYPRKTAKPIAEAAFKKLKPTMQLLEKILQAIELQKKFVWKDKEQKFIPHPSTWLNGHRWEDEVSTFVKPLTAAERATNSVLGRPADYRLPTPEEQAERAKRIAMR